MNIESTLKRIVYREPLSVSLETLRGLQNAFLLSVPFENLDIQWGRHIDLTSDAVFRKIVEEKRGGFCYELNSLFHDLLIAIGFKVDFLAARMWRDDGPGTVMGHMILRVTLEGRQWLVDVGNGKSMRAPLNMDGSNETQAEGISYRIATTDLEPAVLEMEERGEWHTRFIFEHRPLRREEFHDVCEWTQSSPDSRFTQRYICTLATPTGRLMLMDDKFTIVAGDRVEERMIREEEREKYLRNYFGIIRPGGSH